jgi:N-carbamoylputrescine amidase
MGWEHDQTMKLHGRAILWLDWWLALVVNTDAAETSVDISPQRLRVAAISFVPQKLDLTSNADRLEAGFREAAAGGAKLAVAPEGALDGYVINPILGGQIPVARMNDVAITIDHPLIRRFRKLADELDLCLVFGFAEKVGADVFNTAVFIDDLGEIRGKYHKMIFEEGYHPDWWFNRLGHRSRAFDTPFGRCGVLICNDRWNPELARIPALDGAQFLVIPAFGSTSRAQDEAVLNRARENALPVIEANVGVSLIVSEGKVAAVKRADTAVTFAEITIPLPTASNPTERDAVEQKFLAWREGEMRRRFERKHHPLHGSSAAK